MPLEEKRVAVQGIETKYCVAGSGFPVVILPGWGGSGESWRNFLKEIQNNTDFCFYVVDLPGFGQTQNPPRPWTVQDYVNFVKSFLEKASFSKCFLIGHSFGGRVAVKFSAEDQPKIKALILVAAAGLKHPESVKQKIGKVLVKIGKKALQIKYLNRHFNFFRTLLYKILREKDYVETSGTMRETFKNVIAEDLRPFLSQIQKPTLIVWGTKDRYVPLTDAFIFNEKINNSKLEILEGGGHGLHQEMPRRLGRIIFGFLKSQN